MIRVHPDEMLNLDVQETVETVCNRLGANIAGAYLEQETPDGVETAMNSRTPRAQLPSTVVLNLVDLPDFFDGEVRELELDRRCERALGDDN